MLKRFFISNIGAGFMGPYHKDMKMHVLLYYIELDYYPIEWEE